jgi:hypothetical protein
MLQPIRPNRQRARERQMALDSIDIPLSGGSLRSFQGWAKRTSAVGGPARDYIRFATWYLPALNAWIAAASKVGLWRHSKEQRPDLNHCRAEDPDAVLGHLREADGTLVHFRVVSDGSSVVVRAEFCRRGLPDSAFDHLWTDDQRLTYKELEAGVPCRGCGRPICPSPLDVVGNDMPAIPDKVLIELDDAAFIARHAACGATRWSLQGARTTHCSRCCPPPPLSPATINRVADIFASAVADQRHQEDENLRRWNLAALGDQGSIRPTSRAK